MTWEASWRGPWYRRGSGTFAASYTAFTSSIEVLHADRRSSVLPRRESSVNRVLRHSCSLSFALASAAWASLARSSCGKPSFAVVCVCVCFGLQQCFS